MEEDEEENKDSSSEKDEEDDDDADEINEDEVQKDATLGHLNAAKRQDAEETQGGFKNELERQVRDEEEAQRQKKALDTTLDEELELSTCEVFSRAQLLTWLKKKARAKEESEDDERLVVGTVGYPNVGKSSVINVLMGVKKVGVAALPGKTKHL